MFLAEIYDDGTFLVGYEVGDIVPLERDYHHSNIGGKTCHISPKGSRVRVLGRRNNEDSWHVIRLALEFIEEKWPFNFGEAYAFCLDPTLDPSFDVTKLKRSVKMRVKQLGHNDQEDTTRYIIYDEMAPYDPQPRPLPAGNRSAVSLDAFADQDQRERVIEAANNLGKSAYGHAYGRPWLCCFSIVGADRIEYEFDNEYIYTQEELELIISKAKGARARRTKKREQAANAKQPTLFDLEDEQCNTAS